MSRIGKKPIEIPQEVEVQIEGNMVKIKGPKGEISQEIRPEIIVEKKEEKIFVLPQQKTKKAQSLWGLTRTLISNMIEGVTKGYEKKLEIQGIGYRVSLDGKDLTLQIGFTHPIKIRAPEGIDFLVEKNIITISGINKGLVGEVAAKIRKTRPPEPYKGKGIRYLGEVIRRKAGKKAATVA